MKFNRFAIFAALLASGGAFAQTVPAEAWVGPPIATVGGALSRADVLADLQQFQAQRQAAAEAWPGTLVSAGVASGELKRSEVMADTNLRIQAGLGNYVTRIYYEPFSAEEASRVARYVRLRGGPEFAQEVSRLEGNDLPMAMTARGSEASAD